MIERDRKINYELFKHNSYIMSKYPGRAFIGTFVQGSQNYMLDYEESDIDTKSIVAPTFKEVISVSKPISTTVIMPNEEHCGIQEVRHFFKILKKCNIQFSELLFTNYYIINPRYKNLWDTLREFREKIVRYNQYALVSSLQGMAMEKYHALEHPYPSALEKLKKFGYDPKQLHHLIRLYFVLDNYISGNTFENCLILEKYIRDELILVKTGYYSLETARKWSKEYLDMIDEIAKKFKEQVGKETNKETEKFLDEVCYQMVKCALEDEMLKEKNYEKKSLYNWG